MEVAVEGCCHGELDAIYSHIQELERRNDYKIDVLLICGDFQAVRNYQDLQCMAVPDKYKHIRNFYKYYTGEKQAPVLTIVIGGNHEASNYMSELYHGGWLAPKIYFLGCAGSVLVDGVRIAGASGIFNRNHFSFGHYEKVPYNPDSLHSVYHIREYNVCRLYLLPSPRIFLSHDWPRSIERYGNLRQLLRLKSFLKDDIQNGVLGSPPLMGLLRSLRPEWWFSAHLHVRYEALVIHDTPQSPSSSSTRNPDEIQIDDNDTPEQPEPSSRSQPVEPSNPDEIRLDDEEQTVEQPSVTSPPAQTKFLALDKCLPKRKFLEVIDIETPQSQRTSTSSSSPSLSFDPEWLAITRALQPWFSITRQQPPFPETARIMAQVAQEREWVSQNIETNDDGEIPVSSCQTFVMTAPGPGKGGNGKLKQSPWYKNPQTEAFCSMLAIPNLIDFSRKVTIGSSAHRQD